MGWKYNLIANPEFNHQHKANKNQKEKQSAEGKSTSVSSRRLWLSTELPQLPQALLQTLVFLQAWLDTHNRLLGHYINGTWLKPEHRNPVPCQDPITGF